MAEFFLKRMFFARLRATRTAAGAQPVPRYQPETEHEASHENETEDATTPENEGPEDKVDDGAEPLPAAEDAEDDAETLRNPSGDRDVRATWTAIINNLWRRAADNATILAAQARDAVLDAVEKVKELGFIGTAKAIRDWMRMNPWKTALIVVPLVALACTAIALSATGFGPAGIVAGSAAAAMHAGIGSAVAGSVFATCTSAMMGGYGAAIIFGGVWAISTALVVLVAVMRKRWKSHHERALVPRNSATSKSASELAKQAVSHAVFWSMVAAAYAVYRYKSWYRGRGEGTQEEDEGLETD
ncbi:uncharacterized protein J4E87_004629 [Alternaria ethzedia]|uniref:uncharacterized protein n=1 Tax=Alternaria ethzedia TaxID=181014 RepID=UPI0020C4FF42|nr:uncharacterized protein J4E87_004629 [Alternaria ethzedia]KAI4626129.1 hypothetical protein J4E87_004629 [Alternaria ethzedia]